MPGISVSRTCIPFGGGISWSSYWTTQYDAVYNAMTSAGATPSNADAFNQSKWLKQIVDKGYFAKAELLDMFSTGAEGNALINWANPGTYNPSKYNSPDFTAYAGFKGKTGSNMIRLNFNPFSNGTKITQDSICVIIGVGSNELEDTDDFGYRVGADQLTIRSMHSDYKTYFRCNDAGNGVANTTTSIKYYAMSRGNGTTVESYQNKVKTNISANSVSLTNGELFTCGSKTGVATYTNNTKYIRFVLVFSYLTEAEVTDIIDITEEYLQNYNTHLIDNPVLDLIDGDNEILTTYPATKAEVLLTTYDGSGQTIHPSVVDVGSTWNGYRYWMANTPYPAANSTYENPSIWASSDGLTWVVPDGLTNPIVAKPATGFNADTDIYYDSDADVLRVIWYDNSTQVVKMISSADGVTWGDVKTVYGATLYTPSLIKIGAKFYIYGTSATREVKRFSCDTIDGTYATLERVKVNVIAGFIWWHLDVKYIDGYYWLVAVKAASTSSYNSDIYIMKSSDGVTFVRSYIPVVSYQDPAYLPDYYGLYRPTIEKIGSQVIVYYSRLSSASPYVCGVSRINVDLH